jgi:two-component system NtrC family sensor kinase
VSDERILVVDDEPGVVQVCTRTLSMAGYSVQGHESALDALSCLDEERFDLLLVDFMMPEADGLTVIRRAKELDPSVAAVIMTAYGTLQNAIDALQAGARDFILKPVGPSEILDTVRKALEERRQEQENLRLRALMPILAVSQALMSEGDLASLPGQLLASIVGQVKADRASLLLLGRADELYVASAIGPLPESVAQARIQTSQDSVAQIVSQEGPVVLEGEADLDPLWQALVGWPEMVTTVCVPLSTREKLVGLLTLGRSADSPPFAPGDLSLLSVMGGQVATALENARLYEAVAQGRREWEATFDAIADGISILDRESTILRANPAMADLVGMPLTALVGQKCYQVLRCGDGRPSWCPQHQTLEKGIAQTVEVDEPELGGTFLVSTYPLPDVDGQIAGCVHVMKDITERKRAQEQLLQSEKLAALGRLAASLAHEINNPLQALSSGLRLLNRPTLDQEKRKQYLAVAGREVERLIGIAERMIGFYRPATDAAASTDVHALLDEMLVLAGKELEHGKVEVRQVWADDLPMIHAMANQLKQVFLNLILNAAQAMPDGGTLTISTGRAENGSAICVRFADTGHGIAPEHRDHIFEPFYTTREQGSGLGLSVSYSIVQQHGGRIEVESQPGQGAALTVTLPIEEQEGG